MKIKKFILFAVIISLLLIVFVLIVEKREKNIIIAGTGNPGRILFYSWDGYNFKKSYINTNYEFIHTVRLGDVYNNGENVIVTGSGNSFYGPPWGCWVESYTFDGVCKKSVIDKLEEPRCKDFTIGDVDNDGKNELVLGTHGEGIIKIYKWDGKNWSNTVIERNWIKQVDEVLNSNHTVPKENLTHDYVLQSIVHEVKIGDVDDDKKNELVATISSPLEYMGEEISYLNLYKKNGSEFQRFVIDNQTGKKFRGIVIGDAYNDGKNVIVAGLSVNDIKKEFPSLILYEWRNGKWNKLTIENKIPENIMKGLAIGDVYNKNKNVIILATGYPQGLIYTYEWSGEKFIRYFVGNISQILDTYSKNSLPNMMYNSMEIKVKDFGDRKNELVVTGLSHTNEYGWEGTDLGFMITFKWDGTKWNYNVLDNYSFLGMDVGNLSQICKFS